MQVTVCRLRTHQWCFILFNVVLFHALLFGGDLLEEYFLRSLPITYTDAKILEIREKARKLDMEPHKTNISKSYIISGSEACSNQEVFLLTIICSRPENRTRRDAIRQTWSNMTSIRGYTVLTLFALGKPSAETMQREINEESQKYSDVIEGNVLDSSRNQTWKTVMSMEWTVTFCSHARFILLTEEEVFVSLPSLVEYLLSLRTHLEDIYTGRVIHQGVPDRDPQSPGFVPLSQYPDEYYPDYCSRTAFVISQDVARKVFIASKEVPVSVPPDVFVGICAKNAGIIPLHSSRFSGKRHIRYNRCCYKFIFTSSEMADDELVQEWQEISNGKDCTLLETYYGLVSCKVLTYFDKFKHFNIDVIKKEALHFSD
ncbi:putative UDP-GlcNAc:betaGal beta-1,3-N-acetylglucosaminyltransferase LOC100288842 [Alligator sinensis]|uniref:Hexosyltransferase n=1 Tax=Alligator sinensis TaxID=38654 RepID=A0A1U7R483_ALLSI|nr:putative UDP-GlcNAc:betaGal beta-1,3-N-acetylglucosaminyltransferase LOC100288842 [Alligator sinensis]